MLSMLLENMHEDCNQITKKPYVEQKDSNYRLDREVASEYWCALSSDPLAVVEQKIKLSLG